MEVKIMLWYAFKLFYIYFKSSWGPLVEKWLIVMSVMSLVDCNILPWWVIICCETVIHLRVKPKLLLWLLHSSGTKDWNKNWIHRGHTYINDQVEREWEQYPCWNLPCNLIEVASLSKPFSRKTPPICSPAGINADPTGCSHEQNYSDQTTPVIHCQWEISGLWVTVTVGVVMLACSDSHQSCKNEQWCS